MDVATPLQPGRNPDSPTPTAPLPKYISPRQRAVVNFVLHD
jgi:hypothetical protein